MGLGDAGLLLDMIGVVLVGWVVPKGQVPVAGAAPRVATWWAKTAHHAGWALLFVGFGLQLWA